MQAGYNKQTIRDNSALINIILAYYHLVDPDLKVEIFFEKMG